MKKQKGGKFVENDYLSCADVVKMTGVSKRTVWNWVRTGKLKANSPGGRDYVIKRQDFEAFMNSNNRKDGGRNDQTEC